MVNNNAIHDCCNCKNNESYYYACYDCVRGSDWELETEQQTIKKVEKKTW